MAGIFSAATFSRCCRISGQFGGQLRALVIPIVGDLIEGSTSQNGRLPRDIPVSEQVRVVRRLLMHLATLAPMADRVLVMCVPGNHDEVWRDRITSSRDSWAIEAISAVQDALEISGEHGQVTWVYPGEDELSVAVDIDGLVVGATHGHVVSSPDRIPPWLAGQALGKQQVGEADVLITGHFHHLIVKNIGAARTWFQCPAMDNGSAHFRNRKGDEVPSGMISVELTPSATPGWRGLEFHL